MNKGLVIGALALAIGGGAWYYHKNSGGLSLSVGGSGESLSYVPADTVLFAGSLKPMAWGEYMNAMRANFQGSMTFGQTDIDKLKAKMSQKGDTELSPGLRALMGLYIEYMELFNKPESTLQSFGLADPVDAAIYTVGALPVSRSKLADPAAFDAFIRRAEAHLNAKSETITQDGLSYKRYLLTEAADGKKTYLVVGDINGYGVITLDMGDLVPADTFKQALGLSKPAQSLAASGKLETIASRHQLLPGSLAFIDHLGLTQIVTRADNPIAQFLDKVTQGEFSKDLGPYRTPACQTDLEGIAALWPRTIAGYTKLDVSSSPMHIDSLMKIETTDNPLMQTLMKVRGFVPEMAGDHKGLFDLKLGINMDELNPVVNQLWSRATQATFSCEPLIAMQTSLRQSNPAALGAMTGMAQGLQGISISLQEMKMKPQQQGQLTPDFEQLSLLVSATSKQPEQLWAMLSMVQPDLAGKPLPADGQSIELNVPPLVQLPGAVKIGHFGSHLVAFTGSKAEAVAKTLAAQPLRSNGFYEFGFDYGLLADAMNAMPNDTLAGLSKTPGVEIDAAQDSELPSDPASDEAATDTVTDDSEAQESADAAAADEHSKASAEELARMKKMMESLRGMHVNMKFDFANDGIILHSQMQIPKK